MENTIRLFSSSKKLKYTFYHVIIIIIIINIILYFISAVFDYMYYIFNNHKKELYPFIMYLFWYCVYSYYNIR